MQQFNRTGATQKLSECAPRHIQRLCFGNKRMSASRIATEVEWVGGGGWGGGGSACQCSDHTLHQIGLHGCCPRRKFLLKMMHKFVLLF